MSRLSAYFLLTLLGGVPACVCALLAYAKGRANEAALRALRHALNSRMDELLAQTGRASRAEGRAEGMVAGRAEGQPGAGKEKAEC